MSLTLSIDGRKVAAEAGRSLLDVARESGAEIPSLCHHPLIRSYGACRLCLVEVTRRGRTHVTTSCNYEVQDGIEVATDTSLLRDHRRMVLAFLLGLAPDARAVQGLARAYGVEEPLFAPRELSPMREGCILCGLCARVCGEVVGASALTLSGRGDRRALEAPFAEPLSGSCIGCGACAAVCPTGAVEMESAAVARLRERWGEVRPCRYALMGLSPGAVCPNDYLCATCEVDQRFVEACRPDHPVFAARGLARPFGSEG
ncbi:MAG: 2Fe-2S iron-sulfur cluster-binding protein [Deltaproteobacteria bacterium]|nr:2Fe-2S iron-sulfur cluster-binding protein [Deltaproteobacteria bacterium]